MAVKIVYTQSGSDPATIKWPPGSPHQWTFISGTPLTINELINYPGSGLITWPDGRPLKQNTPQGSTFTVSK